MVGLGETVAIPEIVAIGGQSDGKSSLLEALLGVGRGLVYHEDMQGCRLLIQPATCSAVCLAQAPGAPFH